MGILAFEIGKFPFRYLGVPLDTNKMFIRDSKRLVDRIKFRILSWKFKTLSYAGRLQLIGSVLNSMYIYWASVFKIPIGTIKEIESICRGYLWGGNEPAKGKACVGWKTVCKPKCFGGLGLKDLRKWNDALLAKHVWNIVNKSNSLWVRWVHQFHVKKRNFWDILIKVNIKWTWKRWLNIRKVLRPYVVASIGNGKDTSLWRDWWHLIGRV